MATKYEAQSENDRCVACGVCVKVCPRDAVSIYKGSYSVVNEEACIGCAFVKRTVPQASFIKCCVNPSVHKAGATRFT